MCRRIRRGEGRKGKIISVRVVRMSEDQKRFHMFYRSSQFIHVCGKGSGFCS